MIYIITQYIELIFMLMKHSGFEVSTTAVSGWLSTKTEFIKANQWFTEFGPCLRSHANGHILRKGPQMVIKSGLWGHFLHCQFKAPSVLGLNPAPPTGLKSFHLLNSGLTLVYVSQDAHFPTEVPPWWTFLVGSEPGAWV